MPQAQKNPFRKPMVAFPMIAIGLLAVVFVIYYFPITSLQEATLNKRAFRSLSTVSDGLRNRVVSNASVFEQASNSFFMANFLRPPHLAFLFHIMSRFSNIGRTISL